MQGQIYSLTHGEGNSAECKQYSTERDYRRFHIYMKNYHASLYAFSRMNGFGADESHNACKNRSSVVDVAANACTKIVEIRVHWLFVMNVRKGKTEIREMHVAFATITTFFAQPSTFCCPLADVAWNVFSNVDVVQFLSQSKFYVVYLPPASRFLRTKSKFRFVSCVSAMVVAMSRVTFDSMPFTYTQ